MVVASFLIHLVTEDFPSGGQIYAPGAYTFLKPTGQSPKIGDSVRIPGVGAVLAGAIAGVLAAESGILGICGSWNRGIRLFPGGVCWSQ